MEQTMTNRFTPRLVIGLTLIWLGGFWMIDELGLPAAHHLGAYWPIGIVMLGAAVALHGGGWVASLLISGFGLFLLNESLDLVRFDLGDLWPLVLVLIGARMVMKGFGLSAPPAERNVSRVRSTSIFCNRNDQVESHQFERADVTAVFGSSTLDLTRARFPDGATIDIFCLAGGAQIRVSQDTRIISEVFPWMASYEDKRSHHHPPSQTLHLRGMAMWAGVEIHSSSSEVQA